MGSALPVGSLALAVPQQEYFVGDMATFKIPGSQVFRTQGDANNVADDWELVHSGILGKIVFHLPYLGYLLRLPQLFFAVVAGLFNS